MKKYLLALLCANLVGSAWAGEDEAPTGQAAPTQAQAPRPLPTPAQAGTTAVVLPEAGVACESGSCPVCTKKVCVPEPTTKKTTKTLYSCRCEDFCVRGFNFHGLFHHEDCDTCSACETGKCGCLRTKKILVIRTCTEECNTYKCVPAEVPVEPTCPHGWFGAKSAATLPEPGVIYPAQPALTAPPPAAEKVTPPKPDK